MKLFLFDLVTFPQINGDLGTSQIPNTATAQARAAAVAAAQQHRQFEVTQAASVQPQNSSSQAASMTSPPLQGRMSPHQPMSVQPPSTQQAQAMQPSVAPLQKQQVPGQMSPSGQRMTPPRSQGATPPREGGKNLAAANAQSPVPQGDQSNSSGFVSATENKPSVLNVKTEPATPPPAQPQTGQVCHSCYSFTRDYIKTPASKMSSARAIWMLLAVICTRSATVFTLFLI